MHLYLRRIRIDLALKYNTEKEVGINSKSHTTSTKGGSAPNIDAVLIFEKVPHGSRGKVSDVRGGIGFEYHRINKKIEKRRNGDHELTKSAVETIIRPSRDAVMLDSVRAQFGVKEDVPTNLTL